MPDRGLDVRLVGRMLEDLNSDTYRRWTQLCWLDDLVRTRPAPDVLVSNGSLSIAAEFKRLTFVGHGMDLFISNNWLNAPQPFVLADGGAWPIRNPSGWGEVTTRGVTVTDIDICTNLTVQAAAKKFAGADWADIHAILIHLSPTGHWEDDSLTDTDYWDDDEFWDALSGIDLPANVDLLIGATSSRLVVVNRGRMPSLPASNRLPGF
jgi:hypothetical protein